MLGHFLSPSVSSDVAAVAVKGKKASSGASVASAKTTTSELTNGPRLMQAERAKANFNVTAMSHALDGGSPSLVRKRIFEFMEKDPLFRLNLSTTMDPVKHRAWVLECLKRITAAGLLRFEDYKKDSLVFGEVIDSFAYLDGSLAVKIGVNHGLFGSALMNLASEEQQKRFIPDLQSGKILGCFALTELLHGSNAQQIQTIAEYDSKLDKIVLKTPDDGALKWWIGNAAENADFAAVFCQLYVAGKHHGVHCVLAQIRHAGPNGDKVLDPNVEIGDCGFKVGLNGVDNGWIRFNNFAVPRDYLLGKFAVINEKGEYISPIASPTKRFSSMIGALLGGRVSIIFSSVINLKSVLAISIRYAAVRKQFGPDKDSEVPILEYRTHQHTLMPYLAACYALDFMKRGVAQKLIDAKIVGNGTDEEVAEVHMLSAGLKAISSDLAYDAADAGRQLCGGHGFSALSRLGHIRNDADVQRTYEGANSVMMQQVAMVLLKNYNKEFGGPGIFGVMKYVNKGLENFVKTANPFQIYATDENLLRSAKFQVDALQYRAAHMLSSLAMRLRSRVGSASGSKSEKAAQFFNAWNEVLPHAIALGQAHMEYFILSQFVVEIEKVKDVSLQRVLYSLRALYGLSCVLNDIEFFHSISSHTKIRSMRKVHDKLCVEVRQQSIPLVDAWGIPDFLLASPLGTSDGDIWPKYFGAVKSLPPYPRGTAPVVGKSA